MYEFSNSPGIALPFFIAIQPPAILCRIILYRLSPPRLRDLRGDGLFCSQRYLGLLCVTSGGGSG